jgi:hypothetical protein
MPWLRTVSALVATAYKQQSHQTLEGAELHLVVLQNGGKLNVHAVSGPETQSMKSSCCCLL